MKTLQYFQPAIRIDAIRGALIRDSQPLPTKIRKVAILRED